MPPLPDFGAARAVSITILVDNRADLLLKSSETVKYFHEKPLLAEHGFSAVLDVNHGERRILWDAGVSPIALLENMQRMQIDPKSLHAIALSHGHFDHTAALSQLLREMDLAPRYREWQPGASPQEMQAWAEMDGLPLVMHPAAQRERWSRGDDGRMFGPSQPPPVAEWQALGARLILSETPCPLAPGCWTTGYVPRRSFETAGIDPGRRFYRKGSEFKPDDKDHYEPKPLQPRRPFSPGNNRPGSPGVLGLDAAHRRPALLVGARFAPPGGGPLGDLFRPRRPQPLR